MSNDKPTFEEHCAFNLDSLWQILEHHRRADGKLARDKTAPRTHLRIAHENGRKLNLYFHSGNTEDPYAILADGWDGDANHAVIGVPLWSAPGHDLARAVAYQWLFDGKLDLDALKREVKGIRIHVVGAGEDANGGAG